jgi:hypothetical protein
MEELESNMSILLVLLLSSRPTLEPLCYSVCVRLLVSSTFVLTIASASRCLVVIFSHSRVMGIGRPFSLQRYKYE